MGQHRQQEWEPTPGQAANSSCQVRCQFPLRGRACHNMLRGAMSGRLGGVRAPCNSACICWRHAPVHQDASHTVGR
jgi:hypothetical protein